MDRERGNKKRWRWGKWWWWLQWWCCSTCLLVLLGLVVTNTKVEGTRFSQVKPFHHGRVYWTLLAPLLCSLFMETFILLGRYIACCSLCSKLLHKNIAKNHFSYLFPTKSNLLCTFLICFLKWNVFRYWWREGNWYSDIDHCWFQFSMFEGSIMLLSILVSQQGLIFLTWTRVVISHGSNVMPLVLIALR